MSKRLSSMAPVVCMKALLMLLNILFWIFGLAMFFTTIFLKLKMDSYIDFGEKNEPTVYLIIAGFSAILVLATTLACCCTTMGHPALLYLYGAFLAVVAILEFACGATIYSYHCTITELFEERLNNTMLAYGRDSTKSHHLDTMQSLLQCCGNKGYEDWHMYPQKEVPVSCCKVPHGECDITDPDDIYTEGCYNRVINGLDKSRLLTLRTLVVLVGVTVVGVFLACCLANSINKSTLSTPSHRDS